MGRDRRNTLFAGKGGKEDEPAEIYQVGLLNLGNSCFFSSVLQSLSVSRPLADIIEHPPSTSPALLALAPNSPSFTPDPSNFASPLPISRALITVLAILDPVDLQQKLRGSKVPFNPKALLKELARKHEDYSATTQQDSHELLRHLIDGVMMEEVDLIKKLKAVPPAGSKFSQRKRRLTARSFDAHVKPLAAEDIPETSSAASEGVEDERQGQQHGGGLHTGSQADVDEDDDDDDVDDEGNEDEDDDDLSSSSSEDEEDEEGTESNVDQPEKVIASKQRPFIDSIFGGKLVSAVICEECKNVSLTREDFMDISLSLRDDAGNKARRRDRIRKTLGGGFFGRKGSDTSSTKSGPPSPKISRAQRNSVSLSETSASSASEAEPDDLPDKFRKRTDSLEPPYSSSSRSSRWKGTSDSGRSVTKDGRGRDPSPLGRALSVFSSESGHSKLSHRQPKIPKPTAEQLVYIHRILAEVPGPSAKPLPTQLRWAQPTGSSSTSLNLSTSSSIRSTEAAIGEVEEVLSELALKANSADEAGTDLYECFRQFTAVEELEGENSFACQNCWKLLNPELARKRKEAKVARRYNRLLKKGIMRKGESTPRVDNSISSIARPKRPSTIAVTGAESETSGAPAPDEDKLSSPSAAPPPLLPATFWKKEDSDNDLTPMLNSTSTSKPVKSPLFASTISLASDPSTASIDALGLGMVSLNGKIGTDADESLSDHDQLLANSGTKLPLTEANVQALGPSNETRTPPAQFSALSTLESNHIPKSTSLISYVPKDLEESVETESIASNTSVSTRRTGTTNLSRNPSLRSAPRPGTTLSNNNTTTSAAIASNHRNTSKARKENRYIHRKAHKRYLISAPDLPPVLVVHLKRFQQTSKSSLFGGTAFVNLAKRDDVVSFPLEIDLTPFLAPKQKPPKRRMATMMTAAEVENGGGGGGGGGGGRMLMEYKVGTARYRLYSVIEHIGALSTGHYVAYVLSARYKQKSTKEASTVGDDEEGDGKGMRNQNGEGGVGVGEEAGSGSAPPRRWFHCSDEDVRACSVNEVLRSKAYMLFYEKVESDESEQLMGSSSSPGLKSRI